MPGLREAQTCLVITGAMATGGTGARATGGTVPPGHHHLRTPASVHHSLPPSGSAAAGRIISPGLKYLYKLNSVPSVQQARNSFMLREELHSKSASLPRLLSYILNGL